ncbi:MAG TPA: hypothetical protein VF054_06440 [Micromonosporaceae bacterium]
MAFLGLTVALVAAICTGSAAILQWIGAHRVQSYAHVDPRLLWRLLHSPHYAAGLALDGCSFGLSLVALRSLPLFAVQAIIAANLAVVATLATLVLRVRLTVREWISVGAVVAGVALLVMAAQPAHAAALTGVGGWAVLAAAAALAVIAFLPGPHARAPLLGLLAGLSYGIAAIAARVLHISISAAPELVRNPVLYALIFGSILGTLIYATALQRGSVTAASAMSIVGQTLAPALTGWLLLGDTFRQGFAAAAVVGFVLTLAGSLSLAHHAQPGGRRHGLARLHARHPHADQHEAPVSVGAPPDQGDGGRGGDAG